MNGRFVRQMGNLSIRSTREGTTLTISPAGELDANGAQQLESALDEAEASGAAVIVLDLTEVRFVDSSGLVALLMAARRSDRRGGRLSVRAGSDGVRQLLEVTGIDRKLNLID